MKKVKVRYIVELSGVWRSPERMVHSFEYVLKVFMKAFEDVFTTSEESVKVKIKKRA